MDRSDSDKKPNQPKEVRMPKLDKIPNEIRMRSKLKYRWQRTKAKDTL